MGEVNRGERSGDLEKDIKERTGEIPGGVVDLSKELDEKEGWAKNNPPEVDKNRVLREEEAREGGAEAREYPAEFIDKVAGSEEPKDFDPDKVKKINPKRPADLPDISTEPRVFDPENPRPKKSSENLDESK